jgi:DNA-binding NarL/FixJ family response regulator
LKRIAVLSPSPLWTSGVTAVLSAHGGWQVQPTPDHADAIVMQVPSDAADLVALSAATPAVLIGDDLRELSAQRGLLAPLALLSPEAGTEAVCAALSAVLAGLSVRDAAHASTWGASAMAGEHEPLTPRELEVFELLGKGLSNRDIGGVLGISAHTAKYHVGQILAKVSAATRAEAVRSGLQMGLIGL